MNRKKRWHYKYEMLGANFMANLVGVVFVTALLPELPDIEASQIWQNPVADLIDSLFTPLAFGFVLTATLVYEKPVRKYLERYFNSEPIEATLRERAQLRLLNEPFVLIALDMSMWVLAAVIYPAIFWVNDLSPQIIRQSIFNSLSTGLITVTVAFFLLEHVLQKRLAPVLFPEGGLSSVPQTLRIRIQTRLVALLLACNIIPLLSILLISSQMTVLAEDPQQTLATLQGFIIKQTLLFIVVGICLTMLVGRNLSIPFREIIRSLRDIRSGRYENKIKVTTNDEIGYTGDVINEMAKGLKEREQMRYSLVLAREVQQNLLPKRSPRVQGLDIAGTSIYCEETGGDYFDYLNASEKGLLVVVGDVSDHGVSSAMLMTTARAFLRQRASQPGRLEEVATDVNNQLADDVEDSGRFMTAFLLKTDRKDKSICWVNAGHDAAMVFDPGQGGWTELERTGLPFGVSKTETYRELCRDIEPGQVLIIGTDGVWESQNPEGHMFGKQRLFDIVEKNRAKPARDMLNAVIAAIDGFSGEQEIADDVTLVIIKVT